MTFDKEIFWIEKFKNDGYVLYNSTSGGEGPSEFKHSEHSKKLMSLNHKYSFGSDHHLFGIGHSDQTKKNLSEKAKLNNLSIGEKNPMFGRTGTNAPAFGRRGDKHPNSKISDENLDILKNELKTGNFKLKDLAIKYGVSIALISLIKNGKRR